MSNRTPDRRKRGGASSIPPDVIEWFEGGRTRQSQPAVPWNALIFPGHVLLPEWWDSWRADRREARPPAGYEWLDDLQSPRRRAPDWTLDNARACYRKNPAPSGTKRTT